MSGLQVRKSLHKTANCVETIFETGLESSHAYEALTVRAGNHSHRRVEQAMAKKSDFTKQEWALLLDVPPAVGTAVMYAGRSGLGSVKEAMAMASGILGARDGYDGNELIEALTSARIDDGEKSSIETLNSPYRGLGHDEIIDDVLQKCSKAVALLDQKSTPEETDGYIDWTLDIAVKVAKAASEGGFLGIGGERVSEEERRTIKAVRKALTA